jgi:hypothetical protein
MAKCFITGVEMSLSDGYVLDISAAKRALLNLRQRTATLERLIQQLSPYDDTEVYDVRKHKPVTKKFRRLVTAQVAAALSAACPEATLFLSWNAATARRRELLAKYGKAAIREAAAKIAKEDGESIKLSGLEAEQNKEGCHAVCA